jgi:hypothetical protein
VYLVHLYGRLYISKIDLERGFDFLPELTFPPNKTYRNNTTYHTLVEQADHQTIRPPMQSNGGE